MTAPDADYQSVLEELDRICQSFTDLVAINYLDAIKDQIRMVTKQSDDQMAMLENLKIKIESLNAENSELNHEISKLTVDLGADGVLNYGERHLLETCQRGLAEARRETDALKRLLDEATEELSTASEENAELKGELASSCALYRAREVFWLNRAQLDDDEDIFPENGVVARMSPSPVGGANRRSETPMMSQSDVSYVSDGSFIPVPIDQTIENILSQIENNVYLNDNIPPRFKSPFSGKQGMILNRDNLTNLINLFRETPDFVRFNGSGHFKYLLKSHEVWGPGEIHYKEIAREYLRRFY